MGMTSTREGTTQSTKMPRGFCGVASKGEGGEKKGESMRDKSYRIEEETMRNISFRSRDERERDVRLTDGVETRCYVAFRNLVALELPPFLLLFLFYPLCVCRPPLYFLLDYRAACPFISDLNSHCPRRKPASMQTTSSFRRSSPDILISTEISVFKRYSFQETWVVSQ